LYQGTTLVGPYTTHLMRALAPEVRLSKIHCRRDHHHEYDEPKE
jgi:hypothetical protein